MAAGPARLREPRAAAVERAAGPAALPLRSQPLPSAAAAEAFPGRLHTLPTPHLWGRAHQHGEGAHPRGEVEGLRGRRGSLGQKLPEKSGR